MYSVTGVKEATFKFTRAGPKETSVWRLTLQKSYYNTSRSQLTSFTSTCLQGSIASTVSRSRYVYYLLLNLPTCHGWEPESSLSTVSTQVFFGHRKAFISRQDPSTLHVTSRHQSIFTPPIHCNLALSPVDPSSHTSCYFFLTLLETAFTAKLWLPLKLPFHTCVIVFKCII